MASDLWEETTEARARAEEAETAAEQARSGYHELIRRLNTSGASLREIATRLELSHQRVHQIVSGAACSFCDRRRADVSRLVAGPGVFICDSCTALGLLALAQGWGASDERTRVEVRADDELRCCFCRKRAQKVGALASRGGMRICGHCLTLANREFDRRPVHTLKGWPKRKLQPGGLDYMTDRARHALTQAEAEARSLCHEALTDQHLLLGLLSVQDGLAARVLTDLGATLDGARRAAVDSSPPGTLPVEGPMPIDPRLKRHMFETARKKAAELGHNYIGTEHLILALIEQSPSVRDNLTSQGVDPDDVPPALMEMLRQRGIDS